MKPALHPYRYSRRTAWWLARFADLAYAEPQEQEAWCRSRGWATFIPLVYGSTEAFVAINDADTPHQAVLSWRGTTNFSDWLTNAGVAQVPGPFGNGDQVHAGFDEHVERVWPDASMVLNNFEGEVFITGHSLGGAAAELATARLIADGVQVGGLYTFGKPCTGNRSFCTIFSHRAKAFAHRVVHQNDVVPRLPWMLRTLGAYRQTAGLQYLASTGDRWVKPMWISQWLDRWHGITGGLFDWASDKWQDHDLTKYLERLEHEWNCRCERKVP